MQYREHGRLRAETQGKRARRRYQRSWGNAPNLSILDIARYTTRYKEATSSDEELGTPAHQAHMISARSTSQSSVVAPRNCCRPRSLLTSDSADEAIRLTAVNAGLPFVALTEAFRSSGTQLYFELDEHFDTWAPASTRSTSLPSSRRRSAVSAAGLMSDMTGRRSGARGSRVRRSGTRAVRGRRITSGAARIPAASR